MTKDSFAASKQVCMAALLAAFLGCSTGAADVSEQSAVAKVVRAPTKIAICHIPPDDPTARHSIMVPETAVAAHLTHGDVAGACPSGCSSVDGCDDGNPCTTDACLPGGVCSHASVNCDDGNTCTNDACIASAGCVYAPVENGTTCNDGDACTQTDFCEAGSCKGSNSVTCAAPDRCSAPGTCDPSTGVCSDVGCAEGMYCSFCWGSYACIPNGALC